MGRAGILPKCRGSDGVAPSVPFGGGVLPKLINSEPELTPKRRLKVVARRVHSSEVTVGNDRLSN
jgi:hypothetical protein